MSNYTKSTNFADKDTLPTGTTAKEILGTPLDVEFNNIATKSSEKADKIAGGAVNNLVAMDSAGNIKNSTISTDGSGQITATEFVGPLTGDVTGNAGTATTLETARTINGVSFDGSANISLNGYVTTYNGSDTTLYPMMAPSTGTGNKGTTTDSGLVYNASTNKLTATTFSGALSGNATTASNFSSSRTFNATGGHVTGTATSSGGNYTVNLQVGAGVIQRTSLSIYTVGPLLEAPFSPNTLYNGVINAYTYTSRLYLARVGTVRIRFYMNITDSNNTSQWIIIKNGSTVTTGTYGTSTIAGYKTYDIAVNVGDYLQIGTRATHGASVGTALTDMGLYVGNPLTASSSY